ncbi:uncharacterized protein N7518_010143 [Penicillium psychrosexuale]|uniref:uncharacterized protein n=1 Tax=Penicillium psychrosexuale TaxID=1002107 RepID=UPI002545B78D|nr:uncharacterized protein N7518_010143 [Penicillium psychrosexuale]KAJ5781660.1 hypothetical protein N7518_010143 [Penicillium psychrosexuale]
MAQPSLAALSTDSIVARSVTAWRIAWTSGPSVTAAYTTRPQNKKPKEDKRFADIGWLIL